MSVARTLGCLATALVVLLGCADPPGVVRSADPRTPDPPTPRNLPRAVAALPELRINEVVTSNAYGLIDEEGETPDWIELYNGSSEAVSLEGYSLSDDPGNSQKWTFGEGTLGAGEYRVVLASGKDVRTLPPAPPPPRHGLTEFVWTWSDGDYETPGDSTIVPNRFQDEVFGQESGQWAISADLYLASNRDTLGWGVAMIHMGLAGWSSEASLDLSAYNHAGLEMTLAEGAQIDVLFCQLGLECGDGYRVLLIGNGIERYCYELPIRGSPGLLDLSILNAIELRGVARDQWTSVYVTDLVFSHTGHFLHAGFRLSGDGESVLLSDPAGQLVDVHRVPRLKSDVSFGRNPDAPAHWGAFAVPTPGAANQPPAYAGVTEVPSWRLASGSYAEPVTLSLAAPADATVHYTLDGSNPTLESPVYEEPLRIDTATVARAFAVADGYLPSETVTHSYVVATEHSLPVVSLGVDPPLLFDPASGIYEMGPGAGTEFPFHGANFWQDTEVPAHVTFLEPGGRIAFETGVGLRIFGNYSRGYDMKSLSLHFRGEYGLAQLETAIFPNRPDLSWFNALVLRNSGNDFGNSMIRDALASSLTEGMGLSHQQYRPTVAYINGEYWGLHNLREKLNEDYFYTNFGLTEDQLDLLKPGLEPQAGTAAEYEELVAYLERNGAALPEHYAHVRTQVDVDNFIDYTCTELYLVNQDWPGNNVKWWKEHGPDGRWRWVLYDLDFAFHDPNVDMITFATTINDSWPNPEWSTFLLRALLENPDFRVRLVNHCAVWLATNFETERVLARIEALAAPIENEIPRFFARWDLDPADWYDELDEIRSFARSRPELMRQNFTAFFGFSGTYELTTSATGGRILLDGVPLPATPTRIGLFVGNPVTLEAVGEEGVAFRGWSDGEATAVRSVSSNADLTLTAEFQ